jgi:hypothetical protein
MEPLAAGGLLSLPSAADYQGAKELRVDSATSSITDMGPKPLSYNEVPELRWAVRHHPKLTSSVRALMPILHAIVVSKALRTGTPVASTVVDIEEDPEELAARVVLRTYLKVQAAQAFAFWGSLDYEIDRWVSALATREREMMTGEVGLRFHWKLDGE